MQRGVLMIEKKGKTSRVIHFLRLPKTKIMLISLAHVINDMYAGFLPTFIPYIRENLGLSYALSGSFNVLAGFLDFICQPVMGFLCDRIRRPVLLMVGPFLCGLGAAMMPNANSYAAALFFAALWGFGGALYHPQGTGGIGYVANPEHLRSYMTLFNIAGTAGVALGPIIAVTIVTTLGYRWLLLAVIPTLITASLIFFSIPFLRDETKSEEKRGGLVKTLLSLFARLYPIWGIAVLRDLLFLCVRLFLPLKIVAQGSRLESVGTVVLCISLGSSLAMIPMARIAGLIGNKRALFGSLIVGSGILLAAVFSAGLFSIVLYVLGTACVFSSLPLTTTMAQTLAPSERSMASTIVLGLAWGFGNMLVSPFGKLADLFGIDTAFIFLALLPVLALPLFLTPPLRKLKD